MHNNKQGVHIVNTYVNRIHKICVFIFYVLLNAFCCVNQNSYNPKSFEDAYVELRDQFNQLAIVSNDAIAGHGPGYKKASRAHWSHLSSCFLTDKVSSLTALKNANHVSLALPFLVLSILSLSLSLVIYYLFLNILIDIILKVIISVSPFL